MQTPATLISSLQAASSVGHLVCKRRRWRSTWEAGMASSSSETRSVIAVNTAGTLYLPQPICVHCNENFCRCYSSVQWGWGILTVRPRKVRKGSCLQVENRVLPTFEAEEGCLETKRQALDSVLEDPVKEKRWSESLDPMGPRG